MTIVYHIVYDASPNVSIQSRAVNPANFLLSASPVDQAEVVS